MTVDQHVNVAVVSPIGVVLDPTDLDITLDEGWSPYAQGNLTCVLPDAVTRDLLDMRDFDLRLRLELRQDFGQPFGPADLTADFTGSVASVTAAFGGSVAAITTHYYVPWNGALVRESTVRVFDLALTDRAFDDRQKVLTLQVASDEKLLQQDALIATTPWDPGSTSLKTIVQLVLNRYGATLDPASLDATVAEAQATIWTPGKSAWAYLDSMLEAASLRLWCDEARVWRITARESTAPGAITITPTDDMTGHIDRMSADPDVWCDAVVVTYKWVDEFDLNRVEYDVAGAEPATSVYRLDRDTPYPGPGAAAGILNRMQGRGRVLEVEAVSDYNTTPGMAATITPPATDAQTGYVAAVTWRQPSGEMRVDTRALVDTPPTSWLFTVVGKSWNSIPPGTSWLSYTP